MKEGMSSNSTTSISQARKAVEQLKMEACMDRVKVSTASPALCPHPTQSSPSTSKARRALVCRPVELGGCNIHR